MRNLVVGLFVCGAILGGTAAPLEARGGVLKFVLGAESIDQLGDPEELLAPRPAEEWLDDKEYQPEGNSEDSSYAEEADSALKSVKDSFSVLNDAHGDDAFSYGIGPSSAD